MVKVLLGKTPRVNQGEIIRDVEFIEYIHEDGDVLRVQKINFPLVLVLTQDCDLAQDYKFRWSKFERKSEDKWLLSVLVVPLYNLEHLYSGEHLSELGQRMVSVPKTGSQKSALIQNSNPRFHYFDFPEEVPIVPSVADFKHYFSVNSVYLKNLKKENFVCRLDKLFREDVSQRFASFLSRIGLP